MQLNNLNKKYTLDCQRIVLKMFVLYQLLLTKYLIGK